MGSSSSDELAVDLVSRTRRIPAPSLRGVLDALETPHTVWNVPGERTVVAGGATATLTAAGPKRFETIRDRGCDLFDGADVDAERRAHRPRLFGGFAFHERRRERGNYESDSASPWRGYPGAWFVLPRVQVTYADAETDDGSASDRRPGGSEHAWVTVTAAGRNPDPAIVEKQVKKERDRLGDRPDSGPIADLPGIASRRRHPDRDDWQAGVEQILDHIRGGDLQKVVLAQALDVALDRSLSVPDALVGLGERYPDCYRFLIEPAATADPPGGSFFGVTPERLVSVRGRRVETGALAGTIGRGDTPTEDETLARALLADRKNRHEHDLVVEAIRDQLTPLCSSVSAGETSVRRLATVQHLQTPITARLEEERDVLSLVEALHPTPAVGGLPPGAALETIREIEPVDRGWYAAPVGWFDAAGDGTFAVAIRSAVADGATASLFAGVGIVADSDPDREWEEVQLKYRPILDELDRSR